MPEKFLKITELGFKKVGQWQLISEKIDFIVDTAALQEKNVLYAFVVDSSLAYIGKTTQSLNDRLQGYRTPAKNSNRGGSTNIKNNKNILAALSLGKRVDICTFVSKQQVGLGGFTLNFAAALEDSLIMELQPPWNGRVAPSKSISPQMPVVESKTEKLPSLQTAEHFRILLHRKLNEAAALQLTHVDIISGDLHRELGGYPEKNHAMPVCCSVLRGEMKGRDEVLAQPPKGRGATLKIRYYLPR